MKEVTSYNEVNGNQITLIQDDYDYEVCVNGITVVTTGDREEAEIIAESLDVCLTILDAENLLKNR